MGVRLTREGIWIESGRSGRRHPWRWVLLLLTFPALLLFSLLLGVEHSVPFLGYAVSAKTEAHRSTLWDYFKRFQSVAVKNALAPPQLTVDSAMPTVQVLLEDDALLRLVRARKTGDPNKGHLPEGDRPYFEAVYLDESGVPREAKISSRGFSRYHFDPEKPSLRVKINKSEVGEGFRFIELSRPEDPLDTLNRTPERWARDLGLLTSNRGLVRVFVNGRYKGIYVRSYRPGESLGLSQGRLPGTWFKGDLFNNRGMFASLWETVEAWRLAGEETANDRAFFQEFLDFIRESKEQVTGDTLRRFWGFYDFESSARVAAIHTVVGSSHTDNTHNHVYYLSPYVGRLESVAWDINGFTTDQPDVPVNLLSNDLLKFCLADPKWVHRRNEMIWELLQGVAAPDTIQEEMETELQLYRSALGADPNLGELRVTPVGALFVPIHESELSQWLATRMEWVRARHDFLSRWIRETHFLVQDQGEYTVVLVDGHVAVSARGADGIERTLHPGLAAEAQVFVGVRQGYRRVLNSLPSAPLLYRLPRGSYKFFNAVTGEEAEPSSVGQPKKSLTVQSFQNQEPKPIVLGPGELRLTQNVLLEEGQSLRILAGTSLQMDPGVGVVVRGDLKIEGTEEAPVLLEGSDGGVWDGLAVIGPESSVSMSHTQIRGGGDFHVGGAHFKGMVSFYGCRQVEMRHCSIGGNEHGDDAVNIAQTTARISDCRWENALFDGLDLDAANAVLERCQWVKSGNDGLDLMASRVVLRDSLVEGSGDKGVSVGEGTDLLAADSRFESCDLGVQAKDAARAILQRCLWRGNRVALGSYRKKWLFSKPGELLVLDGRFEGNQRETVLADPASLVPRKSPEWEVLERDLLRWASEGFPSGKRNLLR